MQGKGERDGQAILKAALAKSGREELHPEVQRKLLGFIEELSEWGKRLHLIGKGSFDANLEAQILDSILLLAAATRFVSARGEAAQSSLEIGRIADIGSGAGFPGIVWKILLPGATMTLFERRVKQQAFLDRTIALLELSGARVVGEDASRFSGSREFDVVTSKAAGRMSEMAPIAARLLRAGGLYVTIKGGGWGDELDAVDETGLEFRDSILLPQDRGHAVILESL